MAFKELTLIHEVKLRVIFIECKECGYYVNAVNIRVRSVDHFVFIIISELSLIGTILSINQHRVQK